jgi:hypothetical protein
LVVSGIIINVITVAALSSSVLPVWEAQIPVWEASICWAVCDPRSVACFARFWFEDIQKELFFGTSL